MKKLLTLLFSLIASPLLFAAAQCVYETGFSPDELSGWKLPAPITATETVDGVPVLRITVKPGDEKGQNLAVREIDLRPFRGKQLFFEYEVMAEAVSKPPQPWNGVKLMLHYRTPGEEAWRSPRELFGSFGWRTVTVGAFIPEDAGKGTINLGLQDSSGTLKVRKLRILSAEPPFRVPAGFQAAYTDRVRKMPVHRGAMSPNSFRPGDMEELKSWGANLIRWQIKRNWGKANSERDLPEYLAWFRGRLDELDKVLDKCNELGIKVVIDLHTPPGGRYADGDMAMFYEPVYRDTFYAMWEEMAKRYKGHPAVWGYNLINEPSQTRPAENDYLTLQYEAAKRIRVLDPDTPIVIESNRWSNARTFAQLQPLPLVNIIYQAHMYDPGSYTHQGVNNKWGERGTERFVTYPGVIDNRKYDRETLRRHLQPVRDFEKKYGARIYIGEFSAVRWAPGAAQYLEDLITIFEEYGWDWSYHAFREWNGWSVEHGSDRFDPNPSGTDTDRRKVLLKYFSRNR